MCGPTTNPPPESTMGPGATFIIVGMGGPLPRINMRGDGEPPVRPTRGPERTRRASFHGPHACPDRAGLGTLRAAREGPFPSQRRHLPGRKGFYQAGNPKVYRAALQGAALSAGEGVASP